MSKFIDENYLPERYGGKDSTCSLCTDDAAHFTHHRDGRSSPSVSDVKSEDRAKRALSSAFYKEMDKHMAQLRAAHERKASESGDSPAPESRNGKTSTSRPQSPGEKVDESDSEDEYYSASESFD